MNVIVPLAGPDFLHPRFGVRPLFPLDGRPLVVAALESRPWIRSGEVRGQDLVFVLRDLPEAGEVRRVLAAQYEGARFVLLGDLTGGALLSALAGAALVRDGRPVVVDLVDILFAWPKWRADALFPEHGAAVPVFRSDDPAYSYLDIQEERVKRAAEKQVISSHASAGVYLFRDLGVFLDAAGHSIRNRDALACKGTLFVCPAMNGVIASGQTVVAPAVEDVRPIGKAFH